MSEKVFNKKINITLCGEAGQGIQTVETFLTKILKKSGLNVFATKEYMSRVRGGVNSTTICVSDCKIRYVIDKIDLLFAFSKEGVNHLRNRIDKDTYILVDESMDLSDYKDLNIVKTNFSSIAKEIGNIIYSNVIASAFVAKLLEVDKNNITAFVSDYFSSKKDDTVQNNIKAVNSAYEIKDLISGVKVNINKDPGLKDDLILNGSQAVALGALSGGCNFISSYPMSPATGVLNNLAKYSKTTDIIVEQVEDEIAAINMALGAWYAGARAMISTSGGGFALMCEGMSLAGIIESPLVVHLAQRPGPATGLPTRTEQGDLNLALYSGHGDFPRIILAPGSIDDGFTLSHKAFNLADKYQVPVIILTDQYFMDAYYNVKNLDINSINNESYVVKSDKNYLRYKLGKNPISPRAIPGYGEGLVMVDSDEHDETGRITESMSLRNDMMKKRMGKENELINDFIEPIFIGNIKTYKNLIISWGSNFNILSSICKDFDNDSLAVLHFRQVYPLNLDMVSKYFKEGLNYIGIENNYTGQFSSLIESKLGIKINNRVLKYSGLAFSYEELSVKIKELLK